MLLYILARDLNLIGKRGIDVLIKMINNKYYEEIYYSCIALTNLLKSGCI